MNWTNALSEGLPAPRDDEPASLRSDILDELCDHLNCALKRESQRHQEASVTRRAVLERFGDPRRVAWRLWLDANKERIMNQRITLAAIGLMTAVVVLLSVLTWMMFQQGREVNAAILAKLESFSAGPEQTASSLEWTELTVQCVEGKEEGPPLEGFEVTLKGKAINPTDYVNISEKTNSKGSARFGPIRPGGFGVTVVDPWGRSSDRYLVLLPGSPHKEIVVCPIAPAQEVEVGFAVNWPSDLKDKNLGLRFFFKPFPSEFDLGGATWQAKDASGINVLMADDGRLFDASFQLRRPRSAFDDADLSPQKHHRLTAGHYRLEWLQVTISEKHQADPLKRTIRLLDEHIDDSLNLDEPPVFAATSGDRNLWTIDLPEELSVQIRDRLDLPDVPR